MSSVYFVKEKNYQLILRLIDITDWTKIQGEQDKWAQGFTVQAELTEDSFDKNKKIGNGQLTTYLNTRVNASGYNTTIYLRNGEDTIPVIVVYASRDLGEAVGTDYYIYIDIFSYSINASKVSLIGFTGSNRIRGTLTIKASPIIPPGDGGGEEDKPDDLISNIYTKQYIDVTVTDEEWKWLKGLANE